jgi:hypothetical protein
MLLKSLQRVQTGADSRLQNVEIYLFGKCVKVDVLCPILLTIAVDTPPSAAVWPFFKLLQHGCSTCDMLL